MSSTRRCSRAGCRISPIPARCGWRPGSASIPRVVGDAQPIYASRFRSPRRSARIATLHRPYHARLAGSDERRASDSVSRPDRLPFHAFDLGRRRRLRHRARRPLRLQRRGLDRGRAGSVAARRGLSFGATSPTPAATSPNITARRPRPARGADRNQPRALYGRARSKSAQTRKWPQALTRRLERLTGLWRRESEDGGGVGGGRINARPAPNSIIEAEEARPRKRRPPCRHGGLKFREETPKEGICGRSCRTATISTCSASNARYF